MADAWALWRKELRSPTPEDRRDDRTTDPREMTGYWRMVGARTKPDFAVIIWTEEGAEATFFQIGRQYPMNTVEHADKWNEFLAAGWLHCVAVTEQEVNFALDPDGEGRWPDGKPSRAMDEAEKRGIDLTGGGNNPPLDATLEVEIAELAVVLDKTPEPKTQADADNLSGLLDKMRTLLKLAEAERVKEKEPFLQGGRDVDARWSNITEPGKESGAKAEARRKAFLRKEQARLDAEAAAERKRLQDEIDEQRRKEVEALKSQGVPEEEAEVIAPPIEVVEVQPERARAGSAYGRASGLKKVKRGKIVDGPAFLTALWNGGGEELRELAQRLANRAAKAGVAVDGMVIEEVLE